MKKITLFFLCLLVSKSAVAAMQVQALVDNNSVALGETINLTLELSDPTARDQQQVHEPDTSALETDFIIHSTNRSSAYQIINGRASQQVRWQYVIEPQKMGQLIIPSVTLQTSTGELRSQPVKIEVTQTNTQRSDGVHLEATVNNTSPYLYQPVLYTLRLYHKGDIRDVEPLPPDDGVLLERLTEGQSRREVVNGQPRIITEITYLLTPIRSGELNLTARMKGLKADGRDNKFGFGFNMGFANYRPVTVGSEPLQLDVQPPASNQVTWLPLKNLTITQNWETDITQPVFAGTPVIRTLTIHAEGMGGQSFPDLETLIPTSNDFRLRAPKPETERNLLADRVTPITKITQTFSLIPVKTGKLHLPEIRIPWWDVNNHTLKWAKIPAQTLTVAENQSLATHPVPVSQAVPAPTVVHPSVVYFNQYQYVSLAIALGALCFALIYSWYARLRPITQVEPKSNIPKRISDNTFKRRLNDLNNSQEIKQLIQTYAHLRWQLPENMSLPGLAHYLKQHYVEGESMADSLKKLDATLYGQHTLDLYDWKQRCGLALDCLKQEKSAKVSKQIDLQQLNPI